MHRFDLLPYVGSYIIGKLPFYNQGISA
jgi:hypothetical protein